MAIESGEIRSDSIYTLDEFSRRSGLGRDGMRSARNGGLRVIRKHNRGYVKGADWFAYLEKSSHDEKPPA